MWRDYFIPDSLDHALDLLAQHAPGARIIAGGTDLVIELDRKLRPPCTLIDISRLPGLDQIRLDDAGWIHLGPLVTHNDAIASRLCIERAFPLAQACRHVGAPQIRNRGTLAGNIITASPANDTITPLMALDAVLTLRSAARGIRHVPLAGFYAGVRKTMLQPDEMLVDIAFLALTPHERGVYLKLALRRAQAISVVNCSAIVAQANGLCHKVSIALGAVAPVIIRASGAEQALLGRPLSEVAIARAAELAQAAATPIDDLRSSADYRRDMVGVLVRRALAQVMNGSERDDWSDAPVLLTLGQGDKVTGWQGDHFVTQSPCLRVMVNGQHYEVSDPAAREKTLLRLLREDCDLIGTKEGCSEGECGACTVILDGKAVMSCLVPAPRAHGAMVTTVEGVNTLPRLAGGTPLREEGVLHPLQQAFIDAGAVQCGYCTPGFIMSGAALLREHSQPSGAQIKESISGNLCRCTGYYKIIEAFQRASAGARGEHERAAV